MYYVARGAGPQGQQGPVCSARFPGQEWWEAMNSVPLVILAGSDRRPTMLPSSGRDKHPLSGYKGLDVRIQGQPLVAAVAERCLASGCFSPIYLAGPSGIYKDVTNSVKLIDADGGFAKNVRLAMTAVRAAHPDTPVAFTVCDILPDVDTLKEVMGDYHRHAPCDFYFPLVRTPDDLSQLGPSAWKPVYRVVPESGKAAQRILPGHLAVVDPGALRLAFLYRLLQLGYRTRNRSIRYRRGVMVRGVLGALLYQDLLHLLSLRAPTTAWTVLTAGLKAGRGLKSGTILLAQLEEAIRKIFVTGQHRKQYPDRQALLPLVEGLSLALDIDTVEEAHAMGGDIE